MGFAGIALCLIGLWPYLLGNFRVLGMSRKTWGVIWPLTQGILGYFIVFTGLLLMSIAEWKVAPGLAAAWVGVGVINVVAIWIKGNTTLDA